MKEFPDQIELYIGWDIPLLATRCRYGTRFYVTGGEVAIFNDGSRSSDFGKKNYLIFGPDELYHMRRSRHLNSLEKPAKNEQYVLSAKLVNTQHLSVTKSL